MPLPLFAGALGPAAGFTYPDRRLNSQLYGETVTPDQVGLHQGCKRVGPTLERWKVYTCAHAYGA